MINIKNAAQNYYENSFKTEGLKSQRKYPNEELCRFLEEIISQLKIIKKKNQNIRNRIWFLRKFKNDSTRRIFSLWN